MSDQPTPEQVKEFQEKVKNMSPEELKELQKKQCIFCKIIEGEVSSKKVYEDDRCVAILDINPANPGHTLLMPKEHYPLMPLMPEDLIGHLFIVSKELSRVLLTAVGAEGVTIFVANGSAAGQQAQHFMIHIIPRRTGDELPLSIPVKEADEEELDRTITAIKQKLGTAAGMKRQEQPEKTKPEEKEEKTEQNLQKDPEENAPEKETQKDGQDDKKDQKQPEEKTGDKNKKEVDLDDIADLVG